MPATAGRVRMPANNRVHSSAALQTHGIWQSAIGYDPYAPAADSKGSKPNSSAAATENAYASFQGLLSLARITSTAAGNDTRGACKKCGRVGHLTYQCRNFLSLRDDGEKKDDSAVQAANAAFEKIKKAAAGGREKVESESDSDEEDVESSSSDSDVDSEIERIIAERFGKPLSKKVETLSRRSKKRSSSSDEDEERRKKRRQRHKKRQKAHRHRRSNDLDDDESDSNRDRKRKRKRRRESDSDSGSSESLDSLRKRSNRHRVWPHKERRSVLSSESESTASSSYEDERRERRAKRRSRAHRRGEKD